MTPPRKSERPPGPPAIPSCKWCGVPVRPTGGCDCKPGEGRYEPERVRNTELLSIVRATIKAVVKARESGAWGSIAGGNLPGTPSQA